MILAKNALLCAIWQAKHETVSSHFSHKRSPQADGRIWSFTLTARHPSHSGNGYRSDSGGVYRHCHRDYMTPDIYTENALAILLRNAFSFARFIK